MKLRRLLFAVTALTACSYRSEVTCQLHIPSVVSAAGSVQLSLAASEAGTVGVAASVRSATALKADAGDVQVTVN